LVSPKCKGHTEGGAEKQMLLRRVFGSKRHKRTGGHRTDDRMECTGQTHGNERSARTTVAVTSAGIRAHERKALGYVHVGWTGGSVASGGNVTDWRHWSLPSEDTTERHALCLLSSHLLHMQWYGLDWSGSG
jgi:hypothetical protein